MKKRVRISSHAVDRYLQRVDRRVSRRQAASVIDEIIRSGRCRPVPRRWMKTVKPGPGLLFVLSADHPGVALAVRDRTVVTVYSKSTCRSWNQAAPEETGRSSRGCRKARGIQRRAGLTPSQIAA